MVFYLRNRCEQNISEAKNSRSPLAVPDSERYLTAGEPKEPLMDMTKVASSNIDAIGYDPQTRKLQVHFKSGGRYLLHDVEPAIYEQFLKADSPGSYYSKNIRGFYEFNRLEDK